MHRALILSLLMLAACRQEQPPELQLHDAWARPTAAIDGPAAAYLTISNSGGEDRLTSVAADRGIDASLHLSRVQHGVMEMRPLPEGIAVPANSQVTLAPNGMHIMLTRAGPLQAGDKFELTLNFEKSGPMSMTVLARNER